MPSIERLGFALALTLVVAIGGTSRALSHTRDECLSGSGGCPDLMASLAGQNGGGDDLTPETIRERALGAWRGLLERFGSGSILLAFIFLAPLVPILLIRGVRRVVERTAGFKR